MTDGDGGSRVDLWGQNLETEAMHQIGRSRLVFWGVGLGGRTTPFEKVMTMSNKYVSARLKLKIFEEERYVELATVVKEVSTNKTVEFPLQPPICRLRAGRLRPVSPCSADS